MSPFIVVPEYLEKSFKARVRPVLEARRLVGQTVGPSSFWEQLDPEDAVCWTIALNMPSAGHSYRVSGRRPQFHVLDAVMRGGNNASRGDVVQVERFVGDQAIVRASDREPEDAPGWTWRAVAVEFRRMTLLVAPIARGQDRLWAFRLWPNEQVPLGILSSRPHSPPPFLAFGANLIALRPGGWPALGLGCETCGATGAVVCAKCSGAGTWGCRTCSALGRVACRTCSGSGLWNCGGCRGRGTFVGKYGDTLNCGGCNGTGTERCGHCDGVGERGCPACDARGQHPCNACRRSGRLPCRDCGKRGFHKCILDFESGELKAIHTGSKRVVVEPSEARLFYDDQVLEWEPGAGGWIAAIASACSELDTAQTSVEEQTRIADHCRRILPFRSLLTELMAREEANADRPFEVRGRAAGPMANPKEIDFRFRVRSRGARWVKNKLRPFPPRAQVLLLPSRRSQRSDCHELRWQDQVHRTSPPVVRFEAVGADDRGVWVDLSFPVGVAPESIPESAWLVRDAPPPAERAQLRVLDAWTAPANRQHPVLRALCGPWESEARRPSSWLDPHVGSNDQQMRAVSVGLGDAPLALLKGPPGTGKTTVIVELIRQMARQKKRVLLCSQTHQAVRNVIEKLHETRDVGVVRHGRPESLSELEREYEAGLVSKEAETGTVERARQSLQSYARQVAEVKVIWETYDAAGEARAKLDQLLDNSAKRRTACRVEADRATATLEEAAKREVAAAAAALRETVHRLTSAATRLDAEVSWSASWPGRSRAAISTLARRARGSVAAAEVRAAADEDLTEETRRERVRSLLPVLRLRGAIVGSLRGRTVELRSAIETAEAKWNEAVAAADSVALSEREQIRTEGAARRTRIEADASTSREVSTAERSEAMAAIEAENQPLIAAADADQDQAEQQLASLATLLAKAKRKMSTIEVRLQSRGEASKSATETWYTRLVPSALASRGLLATRLAAWGMKAQELSEQLESAEERVTQTAAVAEAARAHYALAKSDTESRNSLAMAQAEAVRLADLEEVTLWEEESLTEVTSRRRATRAEADAILKKELGHRPDLVVELTQELEAAEAVLDPLNQWLSRLRVSPPRPRDEELNAAVGDHETSSEMARERLQQLVGLGSTIAGIGVSAEAAAAARRTAATTARAEHATWAKARRQRCSEDVEEARARLQKSLAEIDTREATERKALDVLLRTAVGLAPGAASASVHDAAEAWRGRAKECRYQNRELVARATFLKEWVSELAAAPQLVEELHWRHMDCFLATCVGVASWRRLVREGRGAVDLVIIDEAGHATLPETLIPLRFASRALLIGDDMQLPPMASHDLRALQPAEDWMASGPDGAASSAPESDQWLERSLFEWAFRNCDWVPRVELDTQFRMHPDIGDFVGRVFYDGKLVNGVSAKDRRLGFHQFSRPICLVPTAAYGVDRFEDAPSSKGQTGFFNPLEARIVREILIRAEGDLAESASFGVITPYRLQKERIRAELAEVQETFEKVRLDPDEDIGSVDSYQGSQRDCIIISFVRSPRPCKACHGRPRPDGVRCQRCRGHGHLGSGLTFVRDLRRLNVAISRARSLLILVGDTDALTNRDFRGGREGGRVLAQFEEHVRRRGRILRVWEGGIDG